MTDLANRFAKEAEQLVGSRFRLHGKDPARGLDCIGLAACALHRAGGPAKCPQGYALRNAAIDRHLRYAGLSGFQIANGSIRRGDLLLVTPGAAQHHLMIALGNDRFCHAHAGLRRVVIQTGLSGWPVLHHWRFAAD